MTARGERAMANTEIQAALDAKDAARVHREDNELEEALIDIRDATTRLEALWREVEHSREARESDFSPPFRELVRALAECYGVQGGIYRSLGNASEAATSYDRGCYFEQHAARRKENSYNLVQRLVSRVFTDPPSYGGAKWHVMGEDMWSALVGAREIVQHQMNKKGRGIDPWAAADLVLLNVLLAPRSGSDAAREIKHSLDLFEASQYDAFVCQSTIRAFSELRRALRAAPLETGAATADHLGTAIEKIDELSKRVQ
jgi:hypothetical protein